MISNTRPYYVPCTMLTTLYRVYLLWVILLVIWWGKCIIVLILKKKKLRLSEVHLLTWGVRSRQYGPRALLLSITPLYFLSTKRTLLNHCPCFILKFLLVWYIFFPFTSYCIKIKCFVRQKLLEDILDH